MSLYLAGFDIGGWHTENGDAYCLWHVSANGLKEVHRPIVGNLFHPLDSRISADLDVVMSSGDQIIAAIDGALAWPSAFVQLANNRYVAADQLRTFDPRKEAAIDNPMLYRVTEQIIKKRIFQGLNKNPLTAVGDKFGNNASKAQVLLANLTRHVGKERSYFPPFSSDGTNLNEPRLILIEVYPAASIMSRRFLDLIGPDGTAMRDVGKGDAQDAARCCMTAACWAAKYIPNRIPWGDWPELIEMPEDPHIRTLIAQEGWIFAPVNN